MHKHTELQPQQLQQRQHVVLVRQAVILHDL
jgi:hypothetical protein